MNKADKIKAIQKTIQEAEKRPGDEVLLQDLLDKMEDIQRNYQDYLTTGDLDIELQRIPEADYELCTALLTAILREGYHSMFYNTIRQRAQAGQIRALLERMVETLQNSESV